MAQLLKTTFLPSSIGRSSPKPISTNRARTTQVQAKIREIFMPALSSTMTEGKIVSWVKSEGDKLSKGESVVVVESDKADMDVETFYDGCLAAIMVEEGGVASVGSAIALLAETQEEIAEARSKASSSPSSSSAVEPASTSGNTPEPPQPDKIAQPAGPAIPKVAAAVASAVHPASEGGKRVVASPYAKKLAKELKMELERVVGSGPMGRIVAKDVEAAAAASLAPATPKVGSTVTPPTGIVLGTVVPFTTMQGAVRRNMVESLAVPTFRVGYTITTNALDALYKKVLSHFPTLECLVWIGLMPFCLLELFYLFGLMRGAIMAVGASQPSVVATKDGCIGMKNQMQVNVTADHRVIYGADLASFLQTLAKIIEEPKDLTF
ncbi:hypothetical protein P3X46_021807 [Hevea brasiliensis]|uniref:Dihydrolipoamide acetyltransferase component of pyruvate dehydrogenase complex n=1 Tax=Hevea brasiliensis TaxID=3981 RepID=A0ABQ9LKK2_HEVBR|nr:hypothetical protein P3X46_021807 [Hevea brasiliensis]